MSPKTVDVTKLPVVRYGGGFILIILLVVGFIGAADFVRRVQLRSAAKDFVETQGVVTKTFAKKVGSNARYEPIVTFKYAVAGKEHVSSNKHSAPGLRRKRAQEVLDRTPVGTVVPVFYDAADPKTVLLTREVPLFSALHAAMLFPFMFFGWVVVVVMRNRKKAAAEKLAANS